MNDRDADDAMNGTCDAGGPALVPGLRRVRFAPVHAALMPAARGSLGAQNAAAHAAALARAAELDLRVYRLAVPNPCDAEVVSERRREIAVHPASASRSHEHRSSVRHRNAARRHARRHAHAAAAILLRTHFGPAVRIAHPRDRAPIISGGRRPSALSLCYFTARNAAFTAHSAVLTPLPAHVDTSADACLIAFCHGTALGVDAVVHADLDTARDASLLAPFLIPCSSSLPLRSGSTANHGTGDDARQLATAFASSEAIGKYRGTGLTDHPDATGLHLLALDLGAQISGVVAFAAPP